MMNDLVIIESPYAGEVDRNVAYAKRALVDSLKRGEFPIASHLLFTQPGILDDKDPYQRMIGMNAGTAWYGVADMIVFYKDYGISKGMEEALKKAAAMGKRIDVRFIRQNGGE